MSAAEAALRVACSAGVTVTLDGDNLLLEALGSESPAEKIGLVVHQ
jgi:hypothetical protein